MKKILNSLLIAVLLVSSVFSQSDSDLTLKEIFDDAEFFFAREDYVDALYEYRKLYKRGFDQNSYVNYKMGICYLNSPGEKEMAIDHLLNAVLNVSNNIKEGVFKEEKAPIDAFLYLGNAYRINNDADKAIDSYQTYKELIAVDDKLNQQFADKQIEACKNLKAQIKKPIFLEAVNLGKPINNSSSNFKACMDGEQKTIVYMNSLAFYDAVYFSKFEDGEWSIPENITPQIQSDGDQYVSHLSLDGKTLFLTKEDEFNSDIYVSYYDGNQWSKSKKLNKYINTKFWESHACLSPDGKTLYFASNRDKFGEMDIFKSDFDSSAGDWGLPVNLGEVINTPLNEEAPFITPDGRRLYFSSQGHQTIGGFDVFFSVKVGKNSWSTPINVGFPINTSDDNIFYFPLSDSLGLMSYYSEDGMGKEDIYKIKILPPPPDTEPVSIPEIAKQTEKEEQGISVTNEEEKEEEDIALKEEESQPETTNEAQASIKKVEIIPIYFAFDDYSLSETAKNKIDELGNLLTEIDELTVEFVGYTDSLGHPDYNKYLSEQRAKSVAQYLLDKGIDEAKVSTRGEGATNYITINTTIQGRKYNRRVEILLSNVGENLLIIEKSIAPDNLLIK